MVYLDAVLEPPSSLSQRGYRRIMLALMGGGGIFAAGFLLVGAYPVTGFLGLEFALVWLVFQASFRRQTARTYVRITADALDLRQVDARGRESCARLPSTFARVDHDPRRSGAGALRVGAAGRSYAIGEHLSPEEQASFARRMNEALAAARRERYWERSASDGNG